jgi:septal ring factor EnvC (AmiA/AmiB activator)
MNRIARTLAAVLVIAVAAPAIAQVTDEDIDRARDEVNRIVSESQELGDSVQAAWARQLELDHEITSLEASIEFAQVQLVETEARLEEVAVELYMGSASVGSLSVLFNASDDEFEAGLGYLQEVSGVDDSVIDQLRAFRGELDRQTTRLDEAASEQEVVTAELQAMAMELQEDLAVAQQVYDDLVEQQTREEEERRRQAELERQRAAEEARRAEEAARRATSTTVASAEATTTTSSTAGDSAATTTTAPTTTTTAPPPAPSGGSACPVAGAVSFSDTWGAPRSGGRTHKGVDMMAARGTPIVAIFDGTIRRISTSNLGGKQVYLRDADGDEYFYAHLDGYGDISVGQSVAAGYTIGYNGSTGNAPDWLPHLHFEHHPGGGSAINPYPLVKSICG